MAETIIDMGGSGIRGARGRSVVTMQNIVKCIQYRLEGEERKWIMRNA